MIYNVNYGEVMQNLGIEKEMDLLQIYQIINLIKKSDKMMRQVIGIIKDWLKAKLRFISDDDIDY